MTRYHFSPPEELEPVTHLGPCVPCLMYAKGDQMAHHLERCEQLAGDGKNGPPAWLPYPGQALIRDAVVVGLCDIAPGLPPIPVCWDHLLGYAANPDAQPATAAPGLFMPNGSRKRPA